MTDEASDHQNTLLITAAINVAHIATDSPGYPPPDPRVPERGRALTPAELDALRKKAEAASARWMA